MTTAASGLVALLDEPVAGSATGVADSSAAVPSRGATAAATAPPVVSSTVPATIDGQSPTGAPTTPSTDSQAAATTTPATASSGCEGQTIDGSVVDTRWGPVQVEAVVSASGQICDVDAIQSPDSHGRSVRINDQALPILHTEVIDAQSASINSVSGATITSRAYQQSLQSILDNLG